ncbi:hypothetical protein FS749_016636 [Ceratobasidium sp. UAMH 11750]|nr:hypothetical protein FS749_016636 [Ceratobasidium sp. UAMH 11750]
MLRAHLGQGRIPRLSSIGFRQPRTTSFLKNSTVSSTPNSSKDAHGADLPHRPPPERFGQPFHGSHPHLTAPDELTPGIAAAEYHQRRQRLMESVPPGSVVVSRAAVLKYMSGQILYVALPCSIQVMFTTAVTNFVNPPTSGI